MATLVDRSSDARFDAHERLTRLRGDFSLPDADSLEDAVVSFLDEHADELQLPEAKSTMQVVHRVDTPTGGVVRLQQHVDSIPVFNSEVIVATDHEGRVRQVDLHRQSRLRPAPQPDAAAEAKKLTPKQAQKHAMEAVPGELTMRGEAPKPDLVWYPTADGLRLAYLVLLPTREPVHDWRVLVDANTGESLDVKDIVKHYDGQGLVFDPNPVSTAGNTALRDPDATTAACGFAGTARATIDAQRVTRTLKDIKLTGAQYTLEGPYAKLHEFGAPSTTFPTETDPNAFNYSSGDDRFECVMAYYHIDTLQRYLQSIGITTAHNSQIQVDPHEGSGAAFFSPVDGGLHFSDSGPCRPDRAEDGECIMHEYGHAIQNNQVPTWGGTNPVTGREETGAMGEGFGDALACIFTASLNGGFGRAVFEDWVFGDQGGLRRVDGTKVYPADWASEVHDDGEIWAAALFNIYRAVGGDSPNIADQHAARDAVLKSVILSHHLLAGTASMPDGAEAVMVENAALPECRGKQLKAMLASFHDRGLLPCSAATDLWIRDNATDPGTEFSSGAFWDSPDLWIRHADDGGTTHQTPEYGQDNWFYARVRNRGTASARAFVATFNVKLWAGTEFVYPGDWDPFVSAAVGFNLAPGASTVVKARWPKELVPAPGSHACWLASVYTPVEQTAAGRHTWEANNLAQKNLAVVDAIPGDTILVPFQIGNWKRLVAEHVRLEVRRPEHMRGLPVALVSNQPDIIKKLFKTSESIPVVRPERPGPVPEPGPVLRFPEPSEVEIMPGGVATQAVRMTLGRESTVALGGNGGNGAAGGNGGGLNLRREAELHLPEGDQPGMAAIAFDPGHVVGLPVELRPRTPISLALRVGTPKGSRPGDHFDLDIVQRNAKRRITGGIRIRVQVVERKR
jgi:hypothetical protein